MAIVTHPNLTRPDGRRASLSFEFEATANEPWLTFPTSPAGNAYLVFKRWLDLLLSLLILIAISPILLLIAICIRLDSNGPVFFTQTRLGQNRRGGDRRSNQRATYSSALERRGSARRHENIGGRPFKMYKFRSMYHNCDSELHRRYMEDFIRNRPPAQGDAGADKDAAFKLDHDPRVTRVGHWLRRTSLDELPQLFNVIKGDMSLIGPRPALAYEVRLYQPWQRQRLSVLPGITGWWQVRGRSRVCFDEAMAMDIYYAHHCNLLMDAKILLLTPLAVFSCRGAR